MKISPLHPLLCALALLLCGATKAVAQVNLTISPSVVSNTYPGVLTLYVTGLTNGEKVIVRRYIDLNSNGSIDGSDLLVDTFKTADGGAMIIGGATNINVPYDSNPTNGVLTTTLNFLPAMILDTIVGQQIFTVESTGGRFPAASAILTVTNSTLAQSVSGTVYSNGVPFPNAVVVFQDQKLNDPVAATVADASGHYYLPLAASTYTPIAAVPGCYYDFSTAPSITLTNGMNATNDLFMLTGTNTVSGIIYDSGNSNAIGALLLTLQSGSLFAVAFTDTNGFFSAPVPASFWKIQPSKERFTRRAYVMPEATFQVDATAGPVTNANIGLPKATALFYGRMVNNSNQPLPNVEVDVNAANNSSPNIYSAKGYTDPNGYYAVAALGDVTNDWWCGINNTKTADVANYIFNSSTNRTLASDQAVLQDFIALPVTAMISGHVQDSFGTNVAGVILNAIATINGYNYNSLDGTTDNSGNYQLLVTDGNWSVEFVNGGSSDNLDAHGYEDLSATHLVTIPPTNIVLNLTVYPIGTPLISSAQYNLNQFSFNVNGATNVSYTVQYSTNLSTTNWNNLYSFQLTNSYISVTDANATNGVRFYRVLKN